MADAIVSIVAERIIALIEKQARYHVNLVRGAEEEVRSLAGKLTTIRGVLDDAEKRGDKDTSTKRWLKKLEDTSFEMDDILDEWNYAFLKLQMENDDQSNHDAVAAPDPKQKVCCFVPSSCLCFKIVEVRHEIAQKILDVKAKLDKILKGKDQYKFNTSKPVTDSALESQRVQSTSFVDLEKVHGRGSDRDVLVSKLMADGGRQKELGSLQVVSIVGVGGLGKTTLAQLVHNDSRVEESFDLRIWICVSDPFDLAAIAKGIIESVRKGESPNTNNLETLLQCVRETVSGKRFLLVLDDVWTEEYEKWEPLETLLKCGRAGSKVLVTTRNERVAKTMGTMDDDIHRLGQLPDDDCWLLLRQVALPGRKEEESKMFEDIGMKIAEKCKGLPLAAKVLGSLLRFKNSLEEWENVYEGETWQLDEAERGLFPLLLLSYNELSPAIKRCFSYCAIFPKDSLLEVEKLIENWMALGYLGTDVGTVDDMEIKGREYFHSLAMRSLFQDFERDRDLGNQIKYCKMHDVVHDFAQFIRKNGRAKAAGMKKEAAGMKKPTCQHCNHLFDSDIKEYRSLFFNGGDEVPTKLCDCLKSLRVLGTRWCKLQNVPLGFQNLIHLRWLDLNHQYRLSMNDLKTICKLYNLETLLLCGCHLEQIPQEIGNLIQLRHLDLSDNFMRELPESICNLHELRTLNVDCCNFLCKLPEGIHRLINLKHLHNNFTRELEQYPQGIAQLTGIRTLRRFTVGGGSGKLGWLKNLNRLSGSIHLTTRFTDDDIEGVVEDAREAELKKKIHMKELTLLSNGQMNEKESSIVTDVLDALEPSPNLQKLEIIKYNVSKLPAWIASPLNQLREVSVCFFNHLSSLPPLGKLPCLEKITMLSVGRLEFVGREFLGITRAPGLDIESSSSSSSVSVATKTSGFTKLKILEFDGFPMWKEWEDITAEEEESTAVSLMPCLKELYIIECTGLTALPHRLLRKAASLEVLDITRSTQLQQRYGDKDGSAWKCISQNHPRLRLKSRLRRPTHSNAA